MRCHVSPRHARLRRPRRSSVRLHPACRSFILFRSVHAAVGFPAARPYFRAYRMCARARVSRRRAYRAPDCAREPNAGRTSPARSQHRFALLSPPGIEKAAPEAAASSRLFVSYHTFLSVKPGRRGGRHPPALQGEHAGRHTRWRPSNLSVGIIQQRPRVQPVSWNELVAPGLHKCHRHVYIYTQTTNDGILTFRQ